MPRYEVELEVTETSTYTDWIEVEADDATEAEELALGQVYADDVLVVGVEALYEDEDEDEDED